MFEKPNKDDVIRSLSVLSRNARDQAAAECADIERSFLLAGALSNEGVVNHIAQAVDEVHIRYLQEGMSILAGYLGHVDAAPKEMTAWARPELENMADMIIGEIKPTYHPDLANEFRLQHKERFQRRIDHALREFELGRVDGKPIKVEASLAASTAQQPLPSAPLYVPVPTAPPYVSDDRLDALRAIRSSQFDLSKLIRLCEELNSSYSNGNYFSVAMLVRAILDHVPPIFSATKFEEVRAKHGGQSFKEQMEQLDKSSRKIADAFLHGQVRRKEVLPTNTQVHFAPALETLLGEVTVRLH
jgi:hypothetical protein